MQWPLRSTTTACLGMEHADYFVFGFARHPVAKFESGVQQAWLQSEELQELSADEMLAKQLESKARHCYAEPPGVQGCLQRLLSALTSSSLIAQFFLNEHLQPSNYRFSGLTRLGTPLRMDFVGKVEAIASDMRRAARAHCHRRKQEAGEECKTLTRKDKCAGLEPTSCPLYDIANAVGNEVQNHRSTNSRSVLSSVSAATLELWTADSVVAL